MSTAICARCSATLSCTADESCWCTNYPPLALPAAETQCLCPDCLKIQTMSQIVAYMFDLTEERKQQIMALGEPPQLIEDIDFQMNEDGLIVFTPWYLLRRGFCCESACTNCPYGEDSTAVQN